MSVTVRSSHANAPTRQSTAGEWPSVEGLGGWSRLRADVDCPLGYLRRRSSTLHAPPHASHRTNATARDRISVRASVAPHVGQRNFGETSGSLSADIGEHRGSARVMPAEIPANAPRHDSMVMDGATFRAHFGDFLLITNSFPE